MSPSRVESVVSYSGRPGRALGHQAPEWDPRRHLPVGRAGNASGADRVVRGATLMDADETQERLGPLDSRAGRRCLLRCVAAAGLALPVVGAFGVLAQDGGTGVDGDDSTGNTTSSVGATWGGSGVSVARRVFFGPARWTGFRLERLVCQSNQGDRVGIRAAARTLLATPEMTVGGEWCHRPSLQRKQGQVEG